jgi:transposase
LGEPKKRADDRGETVVFVEETAFYLLPSVVRTWSRVGQTPLLRPSGKREHLSVIAGITTEGRLLTRMQEQSFKGSGVVRFLKHLLSKIAGKVMVIWDGASIHRCQQVKDFLSAGATSRLRLRCLPAYAPQLNPMEQGWRWSKRDIGNVCCPNLSALKREVRRALQALRDRPHRIRAFFDHAGLSLEEW